MADENQEAGGAVYSVLHQTRDKYKHLTASILLTSSLINHKHTISKQRQQQTPPTTGTHLLLTTKMHLREIKQGCEQREQPERLTNIEELKHLAVRLEQDHIVKLGKENKAAELKEQQQYFETLESSSSKHPVRRHNKRKIVKGRPEMYAIVKKRKFLNALVQQKPLQSIENQPKFRQTINEILNKNNLLKFITTKFENKAHHNNLSDNFLRDKTNELENRFPANRLRRKSAASFKNMEITHYTGVKTVEEREEGGCRAMPLRHYSLGDKRYSSSQTIQ